MIKVTEIINKNDKIVTIGVLRVFQTNKMPIVGKLSYNKKLDNYLIPQNEIEVIDLYNNGYLLTKVCITSNEYPQDGDYILLNNEIVFSNDKIKMLGKKVIANNNEIPLKIFQLIKDKKLMNDDPILVEVEKFTESIYIIKHIGEFIKTLKMDKELLVH